MKIELNKKQVDFILTLLYRAELNMKGESLNTAKSAMQVFNAAAQSLSLDSFKAVKEQ